MALKARIVGDKFFATKFLYAINTRSQRWLAQCKEANNRAGVDDNIINFDDVLNPILNCQFNVRLPPVFSLYDRGQDGRSIAGKPPPRDVDRKRKRTDKDNGVMRARRVDPMFAMTDKEK